MFGVWETRSGVGGYGGCGEGGTQQLEGGRGVPESCLSTSPPLSSPHIFFPRIKKAAGVGRRGGRGMKTSEERFGMKWEWKWKGEPRITKIK